MSISKITADGTTHDIVAGGVTYCTCATAAATAAKEATVVSGSFTLFTGARVVVKFTYANSVASPTLNVAGTGAKAIMRYGTTAASTGTTTNGWIAGAVQAFTYDGTNWVSDYWNNTTYSNVSLGQGYGTCSTAAATAAKVVTLSSYALTTGGIVAVKFTYDVPASATMNINSKGAKAIYHRGSAIAAGVINAGDTATFIYNGSQYHLLSVDRDENTTYSLSSFGVTATAAELNALDGITATVTELNYMDGVTSNVQTQLNAKAASSHTHSYAGSASAGGAANSSVSDTPVTTAGTGSAYTATVAGITALTAGVSFIMVPNVVSTSTTPTLNVNSLGAKQIRRRLSTISTSAQAGYTASWLAVGKPFRVTYDGSYWIAEGLEKPVSADLYGAVPVDKGGTGATTAADALTNLGITYGTTDMVAGTSALTTGAIYFVYE